MGKEEKPRDQMQQASSAMMAEEEQDFEEREMRMLREQPEVTSKATGVAGWLRKAHGCFLFGQRSDQFNNTILTLHACMWGMCTPVGSQQTTPHICIICLPPYSV